MDSCHRNAYKVIDFFPRGAGSFELIAIFLYCLDYF